MAEQNGSNRWWEGYLVRYFVPALFGIYIVRWILSFASQDSVLLFVNSTNVVSRIDSFSLAFLVGCGFLFCYIASYPVLVFHATRVLDFGDYGNSLSSIFSNPYVSTLLLCVVCNFSMLYVPNILGWTVAYCIIFLSVCLFSLVQCYRLYKCYSLQKKYAGQFNDKASVGYAYTFKLAQRRTKSSTEQSTVNVPDQENGKDNFKRKVKTMAFYSDISESYRHLREHGNTAFIVLLEMTLCPVVIAAIAKENAADSLNFLVPVLIVWIVPSVLVHWYAQHIERSFSLFK
ncbi:hypothetical protein [Humidesulfovibrio sp.]